MEFEYLRYELEDGYIHNWLVAGPQRAPAPTPGSDGGPRPAVPDSGVTELPVEHSRFYGRTVMIGDYEAKWIYRQTGEDHFVDLSEITPAPQLLTAWAHTAIDLPMPQDAKLVLTAFGPADVWVNDVHVCHYEPTGSGAESVAFDVPFGAGHNTILIRFHRVTLGAAPFAVALRAVSAKPAGANAPLRGAAIVIATTILPVKRRRELERTFDAARMTKTVYENLDRISLDFDPVMGHWARGFAIHLRTPNGDTYSQAEVAARPTQEMEGTLGMAFTFPDRFYYAVLEPTLDEYVNEQMWLARKLPFWAMDNNQYSDAAYGELVERRFEGLKQAARYPEDVYAEMAKIALKWWTVVEVPVILRVIERVKARAYGSVRELLGLLGILIRYSAEPSFPEALRAPLEEVVLGYDYHNEGQEAYLHPDAEAEGLLLPVCEILAGQRFAEQAFAVSGKPGTWHCEHGEAAAMAWMRRRAAGGFAAWNSDVVFAEVIAGLIHLVEFAEGNEVFEMATALLDKTLYGLALNTYKGIFGAAHGLTETGQLLHGMLDATSGISRLMWGMGAFNAKTIGYVSLACAEDYGFPQLIQEIGNDQPEGLWSRERHAPGLVGDVADTPGAAATDVVMYRTPDYMLSSVQAYHPGDPGDREHVWQATMGPGAIVFTNHPACSSFDEARRPGFWRGNATLPRVAQWQDVVIAVYNAPEDDWMGYTHAYFPTYSFDAHVIREGWAFAQKGAAYLALTAAQGVMLMETGQHAYRELRSYGDQNVWLCQMGRGAQDGSFAEFQEAVLSQPLTLEDLAVEYDSLRGETLAFGWEGPLLRDGKEEPITGARHLDSPYGLAEFPAKELFILSNGRALRLELS